MHKISRQLAKKALEDPDRAGSPRYSPAPRLLLLQKLLHRPNGVTLDELHKRLGVSRRSIWRYWTSLVATGMPIEEHSRNGKKALRIAAHERQKVALTESEIVALVLTREIVGFLEGTRFDESFDRVVAKASAVLPNGDLPRHFDRKILDVNEGAMRYRNAVADDLDALVSALLREHRIDVKHVTVDGGRTPFRVDPYTLLIHKKGLYLVGFSHHHGEVRRFAFDGIGKIEGRRADAFTYPPTYRPQNLLRGAFGIVSGKATTIRLLFHEQVARSVTRRRWHRSQRTIEERADGSIVVELRCAPTFEVENFVLGFGEFAVVLEPLELRETLARRAKAMAARYR